MKGIFTYLILSVLTAMPVLISTAKAQIIVVQTLDDLRNIGAENIRDTIPMRITYKTPAGAVKKVNGWGVMIPDSALNRLHNAPNGGMLPHAIMPVAFLNSRKRPIAGFVINFDYLFK